MAQLGGDRAGERELLKGKEEALALGCIGRMMLVAIVQAAPPPLVVMMVVHVKCTDLRWKRSGYSMASAERDMANLQVVVEPYFLRQRAGYFSHASKDHVRELRHQKVGRNCAGELEQVVKVESGGV